MGSRAYAIFLNGTYGVGKSTVLDHLGDLLVAAGRPFSLMDVDWFHRSGPPADDDLDNVVTEAANISAVWANYRRAGPRQLVISGVLQVAEDRERYENALGLAVRSVRLEASPAVTEDRLGRRYTDERASSLHWHLARHAEIARRLRQADQDELVISTDDLTPRTVAEQIVQHFDLRQV